MYRLSFTKLMNNTTFFAKTPVYTTRKSLYTMPCIVKRIKPPLRCRRFQHTKNSISQEPLTVLARIYREQGRAQAFSISKILNQQQDTEVFRNEESLLLLQCCGRAIVDKSPEERSELCDLVWDKLKRSKVPLDIRLYNKYLEICVENKVKLDYTIFISKMGECDPNEETYQLLLSSACQLGDVTQASKIVSEMKDDNFMINENVYNALVLGSAIHGGLPEATLVLDQMKIKRIPPTPLTYSCLLTGLAERNDYEDFLKTVKAHLSRLGEDEFLKLLPVLGLQGNHAWIENILDKVALPTFSKDGLSRLVLLCVNLLYMKQPEAAIYYYKKFAAPLSNPESLKRSSFFFVEMMYIKVPTAKVIDLIKDLPQFDYSYTIHAVTEMALRRKLTDVALELFAYLPLLRPHYFWPILIRTGNERREVGVFEIINRMLEFGIKPDMDTLEYYIIPNCDTSDPNSLLMRLKHLGFSYKELLTSMLSYLLKDRRLSAAQKLSLIGDNIAIDCERLMQPLCKAWLNLNDLSSTVMLLKRFAASDGSVDYVGKFLLYSIKACKSPAEYNNFLQLVKMLQDSDMKISSMYADSVCYHLRSLNIGNLTKSVQIAFKAMTNDTLDYTYTNIKHPRNMSVSELENHLIELQSKGMQTRGTLRRLINEHCRLGNEARVQQLRQQFIEAGYYESAGMKAGLFQVYVNRGSYSKAIDLLEEIKRQSPEFILDDFKIVDFATLMVQNDEYDNAVEMLKDRRANRGGADIVRNCWHLLNAINEESQMDKLYNILVENGYCVPSNIILGPFVKLHIKSGNLQRAVEVYSDCATKYKCTPLQVELLCAIVENEDDVLLQEVLNITETVYGKEAASIALISTLSQTGLNKSLKKFLTEMPEIPKSGIVKLCERLLLVKDVLALETLAKAFANFPPDKFDENVVYNYLMQVYGINNDCESAVKFYREISDLKVDIKPALTQELLKMVHRCNYAVPDILENKQVSQ